MEGSFRYASMRVDAYIRMLVYPGVFKDLFSIDFAPVICSEFYNYYSNLILPVVNKVLLKNHNIERKKNYI